MVLFSIVDRTITLDSSIKHGASLSSLTPSIYSRYPAFLIIIHACTCLKFSAWSNSFGSLTKGRFCRDNEIRLKPDRSNHNFHLITLGDEKLPSHENEHVTVREDSDHTIRVAHFSDVHLASLGGEVTAVRRFLGKRLLGTVNLRFFGRGDMFHDARQRFRFLLQDIQAQGVDFAFSSGDFSAMGFPVEFQMAKRILEEEWGPDRKDLAVIPGNHDRYTCLASWTKSFEKYFGQWTRSDLSGAVPAAVYPFVRLVRGKLAFFFVDVTRFHPLSRGRVTTQCVNALEHLLSSAAVNHLLKMLVIHYPPVRADGSALKFEHRCTHIDALIDLGLRHSVRFLFCGHVHENYLFQLPQHKMTVINAGAATFSKRSTYNIYSFTPDSLTVDRREYIPDGQHFDTFDRQTLPLIWSDDRSAVETDGLAGNQFKHDRGKRR